jgi:hypothetical protein
MVRVLLLSCSLIVASMTTQVQAQGRGLNDYLQECGFGSVFFPNDANTAKTGNLLTTSTGVIASALPYFWMFGSTSSSTTSTSNLLVCNGAEATAAAIIHHSYEQLEVELAAGEGPYLSLLSSVVNGNEQSDKIFAAGIRKNFSRYVGTPEFSTHERLAKEENLFNFVVR